MSAAAPTGSGSERPGVAAAGGTKPGGPRLFTIVVIGGSFVIAALVAALVVGRIFFYELFSIPSGAMKPTLLIGDWVLVAKYSGTLPQRGDVAVFRLPRDPKVCYIKRIVGLPGDRIQMIEGVLQINGEPVAMQRIDDAYDSDPHLLTHNVMQFIETLPDGAQHPIYKHPGENPLDNTAVFTVPQGHVFAMGDNRDNSLDSRVPPRDGGVGFVPLGNLIGRADIRYFSFDGKDGVRFSRLFTSIH